MEASYYFKKALEFNPTLHIAEVHLRELGQLTEQSTNWYTIVIIITLVTLVLIMVYYLVCYY